MDLIVRKEKFDLYFSQSKLLGQEKESVEILIIGIKHRMTHGSLASEIILDTKDVSRLRDELSKWLDNAWLNESSRLTIQDK